MFVQGLVGSLAVVAGFLGGWAKATERQILVSSNNQFLWSRRLHNVVSFCLLVFSFFIFCYVSLWVFSNLFSTVTLTVDCFLVGLKLYRNVHFEVLKCVFVKDLEKDLIFFLPLTFFKNLETCSYTCWLVAQQVSSVSQSASKCHRNRVFEVVKCLIWLTSKTL